MKKAYHEQDSQVDIERKVDGDRCGEIYRYRQKTWYSLNSQVIMQ